MNIFKKTLKRLWRAFRYPHETNIVMSCALGIKVNRATPTKRFSKNWFQEGWNLFIRGNRFDYGIVSRNLITKEGVRWLADLIAGDSNSLLNGVPAVSNLKYHAWGTGTAAEAVTDSALAAEAAPTASDQAIAGTHVSATSGNNATFTSVGTITAISTLAITEHAIMDASQQGVNDEVYFDRSVFSAVNVVSGDSITFTYTLTINSGG
jgi:hypothetical protein